MGFKGGGYTAPLEEGMIGKGAHDWETSSARERRK
jgi:hypothetical protein